MNAYRKPLFVLAVVVFLACAACSSGKDSSHTTATTFVPPPTRQVLRAETKPAVQTPAAAGDPKLRLDPTKPFLVFNLQNGRTFREGEEVAIDFSLANAQLKGAGGNYRVRYIVDDDDMKWIDRWEQVILTGWLPGKHTIRIELIGPDGWPYRNGDYNVVTREITVIK